MSAASESRPVSIRLLITGVVLAGMLFLPGLAGEESCGECEEARRTNGWCDVCEIGYVGDVAIASRHLWHFLDAHGHTLNLDNLGCDECSAAVEVDGYCSESKIGFVDQKAYFSRLTWLLAKAEHREPAELHGGEGSGHSDGGGWCEKCGLGRVGRWVLDDREDFENLVHDLEILAVANEATHCEHCAVAIMTDTECPVCRIRYLEGKPNVSR